MMQDHTTKDAQVKTKKAYNSPTLQEFGDVAHLTLGGSPGNDDLTGSGSLT